MRRQLLLAAVIAVVPAALQAQHAGHQGAPQGTAQAPAPMPAPLRVVRGMLRNLVVAQEAHYADSLTYSSNVLRLLSRRTPDDSAVAVTVLYAGKKGWAGMATHPALPGRSCVIVIGELGDFAMPATLAEKRQPLPDQQGTPICDAPTPSAGTP